LYFFAAVAAIGLSLARSRALASGQGCIRNLHSLPSYYGYNAALLRQCQRYC